MRSRRGLFLVVLLVAAVACGEEAAEPTPTESSAATSTPTTAAPATTEAPTTTPAPTTTTTSDAPSGIEGLDFEYLDPASFPTIELVDPGAEPLEIRSWTPPVGTVVAMTTTLSSGSTQTAGGADPTNSDFTATIDSTVEIVALTDEGFVARTVFDATDVSASDPLSQSALEAAYAALIGVEVYQLTRPDGAIIAQAGIEALGQGDALGNGLGGIAVPLPSEPIGIGAVWTADQIIGVEGIQIVQTVTTRIVDIQGDLLTIEIEATSAFDPDSDTAALGSIELQGTSTGTAVWDLRIGMPISAVSESIQDVNSTDPVAPFSVRTITTIEITAELLD
jgi:hypothetical protein